MTGVESFLKRELNIRFIDARTLATEAKNNLGISGYPSADQKESLKAEACRIFKEKSEEEKVQWRFRNVELNVSKEESIRNSAHSVCSMRSSGSNHSLNSLGGRSDSGSVYSDTESFKSRSSIASRLKASSWLPGARRQQ